MGSVLAVVLMSALGAEAGTGSPLDPPAAARVLAFLDRLPLRFERNVGQAAAPAQFLSRGRGYTLFVTPTEMALSLRRRGGEGRAAALRVSLLGARGDAAAEGVDELAARSHYFIGDDPKKWRTEVPAYSRVRCREVYPGIDLVYHGSSQEELEYDFVVAPGSDPRRIRLGFEGGSVRLDAEGNLVVALEGGEVVKRAPRVYQEAGSSRDVVPGRWVLRGRNEAGFEVGPYDASRALVIDPVLTYSTHLGGNLPDRGYGIAVDASGSMYVTGEVGSSDFPTQNPFQTNQPDLDAFVTKLSPSGDTLMYSTYLGGDDWDRGNRIAVDASGSAYVTGITLGSFPTQNPIQANKELYDIFVTKLSPSGNSLVYSTTLGGNFNEEGTDIAVDATGSAWVVGWTISTDFPIQNALQTDRPGADVILSRLSPSGTSLLFSTYLGGDGDDIGQGIALDDTGSVYLTGYTASTDFPTLNPFQTNQPDLDAFVTKLSPLGDQIVYSTYLGGNLADRGLKIAVDASGSAYITGETESWNFPTQDPFQTDQSDSDAFVTKLSPSGTSLVYSTYLGGFGSDLAYDIAVDGAGRAHVVGTTGSLNFPTLNPYQGDRPMNDAFVTQLTPSGNAISYSTYLGSSGDDDGSAIALDSVGNIYVTGFASAADFPTLNPFQSGNPFSVFVARFSPSPMRFFTVAPCRLIDTRSPAGPLGGPALAAGADRTFTVAGACGIPATARALSVNIAVTEPFATGNLRLYPAGTAAPLVSSINYAAGQTRANNAILPVSTAGALSVRCTQASGTAELVLDVNGYFE